MLISNEYKALQVKAHQDRPDWGQAGMANRDQVLAFCKHNGFTSLLDYGSGKGHLGKSLGEEGIAVTNYDPGMPEYDTRPEPHDFVVCFDVLEHVEPDCIEAVLDDLKSLILKAGIFTISTAPAKAILSDGSNAHRCIRPKRWWVKRLEERFGKVQELVEEKASFAVLVQP